MKKGHVELNSNCEAKKASLTLVNLRETNKMIKEMHDLTPLRLVSHVQMLPSQTRLL